MNKAALQDWTLLQFWPRYLALTNTPYRTEYGPGDRGTAVASMAKLKPSEALREEILDSIRDITIHRRKLYNQLGRLDYNTHSYKNRGNKIYTNRMASTWLNNNGWLCEIPSISEMKINKVVSIKEIKCSADGCNEIADPISKMCKICEYKQA